MLNSHNLLICVRSFAIIVMALLSSTVLAQNTGWVSDSALVAFLNEPSTRSLVVGALLGLFCLQILLALVYRKQSQLFLALASASTAILVISSTGYALSDRLVPGLLSAGLKSGEPFFMASLVIGALGFLTSYFEQALSPPIKKVMWASCGIVLLLGVSAIALNVVAVTIAPVFYILLLLVATLVPIQQLVSVPNLGSRLLTAFWFVFAAAICMSNLLLLQPDLITGFVQISVVLIVGILGLSTTVLQIQESARLQREATLKLSEHRYQMALEGSNEGIFEWNLVEKRIIASARAFEIMGLEYEESWFDQSMVVGKIPAAEQQRIVQTNLLGGEDNFLKIDTYRFGKKGAKVHLTLKGKVERDPSGAINKIVGSIGDISDQKNLEQRLRHEALHDFLTGLPNRTLLVDRIQHILTRLKRNSGLNTAILFIDIDNFKTINDNLGHGFGDDVLVSISERLLDVCRASDTVARIGGDEFVVLMEELTATEEAKFFADRLVQGLREPLNVQNRELNLSASIGLVLVDDPDVSVEGILGDADIAMYEAKQSGKSKVVAFEASMRAQAAKRLEVDRALRLAIDHDELYLVYQPIYVIDDGQPRPAGVEALLRWTRSDGGNIAPGELLATAEENGMIETIGFLVLRTAVDQLEQCRKMGFPEDFYININLSSCHFEDTDIVDLVTEALDGRQLSRDSLRIELVESAVIRYPDRALNVIKKLKREGIHVSIDDFGTGFSSLSYLHRFPFYSLKIDRSFVIDLSESKATQDIVMAIIAMAKKLGIRVVAEGIETQEQLAFLSKAGCEYGQGYLLAKPQLASSLEQVFKFEVAELA